jgi:hypothetical protein
MIKTVIVKSRKQLEKKVDDLAGGGASDWVGQTFDQRLPARGSLRSTWRSFTQGYSLPNEKLIRTYFIPFSYSNGGTGVSPVQAQAKACGYH